MVRKDLSTLSDEEFDSIIEPVEDKILNEVREKLIDEFVAYYINEFYRTNALWNESLEWIVNGGIDGTLSQFRGKDCNIDRMKKIFKDKYKLEITKEKELDVIEL